jgi:hypothetical protein
MFGSFIMLLPVVQDVNLKINFEFTVYILQEYKKFIWK